MSKLRGNVRYRFRSDDHDVNVVIEGDVDWVSNHVDKLGLAGVGGPCRSELKLSPLTFLRSVKRDKRQA